MLERFGQSLRLGIGRDRITLVRCKPVTGEIMQVVGDLTLAAGDLTSTPLASMQLQLLLAKAGNTRGSLSVVVADDWTRLWQVTPPPAARRFSDLQAAAAVRFQTLFGEPASDWSIAADWDLQAPFFAAALPRWLMTALEQEARARKLSLLTVAPQFLIAWNRWCKNLAPNHWFALVHDGVISLGAVANARLVAVSSTPMPATPDSSWLGGWVQREALRRNLPAPTALMVCGELPGEHSLRCTRLDTPRRRAAEQSVGVVLALTGVLQ